MLYDLIVIGGGPAGYLAAERAGKKGLNTLLIEKNNLGGVCLNEGCIPSKTLLYSAKIFDSTQNSSNYGITTENAKIDQVKVIKRKQKVVRTLVAGVKNKLKNSNVTVVKGYGRIVEKAENIVIAVEENQYIGKNLLIATGSSPIIPPIKGLAEVIDSGNVLTNKEILDLKVIPESLIIIGGGVIGLEMASYYNSVGCHVTVVEMLNHIGGNLDEELSTILQKNYVKKGVEFLLNSKVIEINEKGVVIESENQINIVSADKILLSVGRTPNVEKLGLEKCNIKYNKSGINTNQLCETSTKNVYAAGDVNGISMLAHTAYREAEVCINNILGINDKMKYNAIPNVIYTNPEVASVGETEQTAKEKKLDFEIIKLPLNYSGRYVAEVERGDGICKLLINKNNNCIIGAHIIGSYVSEIIYGVMVMIGSKLDVDDIKKFVFPHPTVSEIIREAIFEV